MPVETNLFDARQNRLAAMWRAGCCRRAMWPRASLCVVVLAALGGCAAGPDFQSPLPPDVTRLSPDGIERRRLSGAAQQAYVQGLKIPEAWWQVFHCQALDTVIARAVADNADLAAARAAVWIASANTEAAAGGLLPQVSANGDVSRQRPATTAFSTTSPYAVRNGQIAVAFMPDVFGGSRRHVEQLAAETERQHFELQAAYLTLSSRVALAAIDEAALRAEIRAVRKTIAIARELRDALQEQFAVRDVTSLDLATQDAALAQQEQALPPLHKRLAAARNLLVALTGHLAGEGMPETFELDCLRLPKDLPLSLPSEIVRRRPDIRAAEANMHAASAEIGVAIANRLPQFNLTASVGSSLSTLASLTSPMVFWTLAGSASQVLFDGFSAGQRQRAAEAGLNRAAAQYRSAVIGAFQNVADVLHAIDADRRATAAALRGEAAANTNLKLAREMLKAGQVTAQQVLTAQQLYAQAATSAVRATAANRADAVLLFQALGGGWSATQ